MSLGPRPRAHALLCVGTHLRHTLLVHNALFVIHRIAVLRPRAVLHTYGAQCAAAHGRPVDVAPALCATPLCSPLLAVLYLSAAPLMFAALCAALCPRVGLCVALLCRCAAPLLLLRSLLLPRLLASSPVALPRARRHLAAFGVAEVLSHILRQRYTATTTQTTIQRSWLHSLT